VVLLSLILYFFGEGLPRRFHELCQTDFEKCDLLIVMGTSLKVQPFASLVDMVPDNCVRLLLNNEAVGVNEGLSGLDETAKKLIERLKGSDAPEHKQMLAMIRAQLGIGRGFAFGQDDNVRDVFHKCDCDSGCLALADLLGWRDELNKLIEDYNTKKNTKKDNKKDNKGTKNESKKDSKTKL